MSKCWWGKPCHGAACWQHAIRCPHELAASQQLWRQASARLAVNSIAMCIALSATGFLPVNSLGDRHLHAWLSVASPWALP